MRRHLLTDVGRDFAADTVYNRTGFPSMVVDGVDPSIGFPQTRFHLIGDSNGNGSDTDGTGYSGGWREVTETLLRAGGSDFDFVGSKITMPEGSTTGLVWNDTVPGAGLVSAAANFASWVASPAVGIADFTLDSIGANDILQPGMDLPTLQARRRALDAAYDAAAPTRQGSIIMSILPLVAGSGTGGNLGTWNALRQAYNAFLADYAQSKRRQGYLFVNPFDALALGEFQTDGEHTTQLGQAVGSIGIYALLQLLLGDRRGFQSPRSFHQRKWAGSIAVAGAGQGLSVAAHPGFNPGSGSFSIAWDLYPTALPGGALNVLEYGQYNVTDFFLVQTNGRDLLVYWNDIAGTLFPGVGGGQGTGGATLTLNQWARCNLMVHAPSGTIGLYVNGQLIGCKTGLPPWAFAQHTMTFGKGPSGNAQQGFYGNVRAFQGGNVPRPGSMAALVAAENDFYLASSTAPGQCSASFWLDSNLIDNIFGNPAMTLVGGATQVSAYPGTTPRRPWEYGP